MAQVKWTPGSLSDIDAIAAYIALDSRIRAKQQVLRIMEVEELLVQFPGGGRVIPEMRSSSYREVIVPPYRILYHLSRDREHVGVLGVIHSKQRLRGTLFRRRRRKEL
jgi:toxin ParE1/3/4